MARTKLSTALTGWSSNLGTSFDDTTANRDQMVAKMDEHDDALDRLDGGSLPWFLPDVANDFDPSASGLTGGRVGAKVGTVDGSKGWERTGTGDTDWTEIGSD